MVDYAASGKTIQTAMLELVKSRPKGAMEPPRILWAGAEVYTADLLSVPATGVVRAQFLSPPGSIAQGFDLKVDGWLELAGGERVNLLRTWNDERYEPVVEYRYSSRDGRLRVWNVYRVTRPDGSTEEEKWTGNAGFWIEHLSASERIYHCSPGPVPAPSFDSLVFRLSIR